jgi:pimeloyl-ACP methyl ester carboxylesterase
MSTSNTVTSQDGTRIAFSKAGQGPAVILVDGAFCFRQFGPMMPLTERLSPHFTVYAYDRRGRGESTDTQPYAVEREIEDIAALIEEAGGSAYVYGTSSGAGLALNAAASGLNITKLALFEPPYNDDPANLQPALNYKQTLGDAIAEGRRGDAATTFMTYVGTPAEMVDGMRGTPVWSVFEAVAPTLGYDATVMGDFTVPTELAAKITAPTLVMAGGEGPSPEFMRATARTIQQAIPNAEYHVIEGQGHDVDPDAVSPLIIEFFNR